jgi:hypothetical protein
MTLMKKVCVIMDLIFVIKRKLVHTQWERFALTLKHAMHILDRLKHC